MLHVYIGRKRSSRHADLAPEADSIGKGGKVVAAVLEVLVGSTGVVHSHLG